VPESFDVAVVGAGPAGATVARLLAALGHRVVLLHAEQRSRGPEVESLPPSALGLVESLGLADAIRGAAVAPMAGTVVAWDDGPVETSFSPPGLQLARDRLDPALRFAAVSAGAVLEERRVAKDPLDADDVGAPIVVDATGRRSAARETIDAWRTLAVTGVYPDAPDDARTWTEAFDRGWIWCVPSARGGRQATVMIDRFEGSTDGGLERRFEVEVARAAWTSERLGSAPPRDVHAVEISPSIARTIATPRGVRVGDAACAVDPLSSFGLKKALESARMATVVVNTMLADSACAAEARAAYAETVQAELAACLSGAAAEAARAAKRFGGPFWARRTFERPPPRPAPPPGAPASGRLRLAPDARIETRAVEDGWIFARRPVIVCDRFPRGLRFVDGLVAVDVARAATGGEVPDRMRRAVATLVAWGVLYAIE